eukprot:CAMPEP_0201589132 /NCGR_PEP_ID=MMETSP0190_2-20130828/163189_1 /ASSEMBLY_ACC=CAM_ASM_000263 /TAXON_ID=37353 /ORGANISM="Rosalina sp." /LENGTH=102 /DNA_ID=CAMNT_0048042677 /DNA_START=339 /DNA_END=648 /DNA_ORIENTATION=+
MKIDPDNAEEKDTEKGDGTNSNASTPKTANSDGGNNPNHNHNLTDSNIKGGGNISGIDNNAHNATTLVSPSILHRKTGVGVDFEIDDGNKSDGGTSSIQEAV